MTDLEHQLRLLIKRYGAPEVRKQLTKIIGVPKRLGRKSAVQYVNDMSVPATNKEKLLTLANAFEGGSFLPATADIRDLFHSIGKKPRDMKSRQAAIPAVFKLLASCPTEFIDRIVAQSLFSGPVELAPIAEAIRATSARIRRTHLQSPSNAGGSPLSPPNDSKTKASR